MHANKFLIFKHFDMGRNEVILCIVTICVALRQSGRAKVKKVKIVYTVNGIQSVTCHMASHSITCHPTQVITPRLNPIAYPGGMEGWVDLGDLLHTEMVCNKPKAGDAIAPRAVLAAAACNCIPSFAATAMTITHHVACPVYSCPVCCSSE